MATPEERALLQAAAQKYTGKDFGSNGYDQAFEQSGMSAQDRIKEILASPEARNYAQQQAQTLYQPQASQIGIAENQANDSYANLMQALEARQKALPEQTLGEFNRRGLLRSGLAVQGLNTATADLNRSITSTQQERAYKLADLASQRAQLALKQAGYATDFLSNEQSDFEKANTPAAGSTQVVKVNGHQLLIDKTTGKTIQDLGSSGGGGDGSGSGNYTAAQLRKLAAYGVDASNTGAANAILYPASVTGDVNNQLSLYDTGGADHSIDYNPTDKGDKVLSQHQAEAAYGGILDLVGGNEKLAASLYNDAIKKGGYTGYQGINIGA